MTQMTPVTFTSPVTADGLHAALDEHGLIERARSRTVFRYNKLHHEQIHSEAPPRNNRPVLCGHQRISVLPATSFPAKRLPRWQCLRDRPDCQYRTYHHGSIIR